MKKERKFSLNILIVCLTLLVLSILGAVVYMNKLNVDQRNKQLEQERVLKERDQKRQSLEKRVESDCAYYYTNNIITGSPQQTRNEFACSAAKEELSNLE